MVVQAEIVANGFNGHPPTPSLSGFPFPGARKYGLLRSTQLAYTLITNLNTPINGVHLSSITAGFPVTGPSDRL